MSRGNFSPCSIADYLPHNDRRDHGKNRYEGVKEQPGKTEQQNRQDGYNGGYNETGRYP